MNVPHGFYIGLVVFYALVMMCLIELLAHSWSALRRRK